MIRKVTSICKNPECGKEFTAIPSRRQKYCNTDCYRNDPKHKRRRRASLNCYFNQEKLTKT